MSISVKFVLIISGFWFIVENCKTKVVTMAIRITKTNVRSSQWELKVIRSKLLVCNKRLVTKLSLNFGNGLDTQSELKVKTSQLLRHNQMCVTKSCLVLGNRSDENYCKLKVRLQTQNKLKTDSSLLFTLCFSLFVDIQDSQVTSQVGNIVLHLTKYKTKPERK